MGKIAFIFPGQGSQKIGMGQDFYENSPKAKEIFDTASEAISLDMKALCFQENDQLNITEFTQAALVTTSIAIMEVLKQNGIEPDITAGLSLGEYSALVASQVMSFEDAVKAVRQRGILMQEAVPTGIGAMSAILGLEAEPIEKILNEIEGVQIANYNCPGQIVISGLKESVEEANVKLKEAGAKRTLMLNVSGPFHSDLLKEAGERLGKVLVGIDMQQPRIPYVANVTAGIITDVSQVQPLLIQQVSSCVKWQQSVETMLEYGVDTFIEIGPGTTLSGFLKKILKGAANPVTVYNVETMEDMNKIVEALV